MRAAIAGAVVALAAAAAAGCGERAPGDSASGPPVAAGVEAITIEAPADGRVVRARQTRGGGLRARTTVRGRAQPRSAVFVSAGCRPPPCRARATADRDGRWAAAMVLRLPRAGGFVTIDANKRNDVVASGSAVATIELVGPQGRPETAFPTPSRRSRPDRGAAAPERPTLPRDVLLIGDSLAVGMAGALRAALPGWRVRVDGATSRPLGDGLRILAEQGGAPAILAFSLFTNDDPRNTRALEAAVRATATRPGGCAVWATIVRPPVAGAGYEAANELLGRLATDPELALGLQVVDWSGEVARSPSVMAADGVHASPAGYRTRALLYAEAIRRCAG